MIARLLAGGFNITMSDAEEIVLLIYQMLRPDSVVHFGCGDGSFLSQFRACGVGRLMGVDVPPQPAGLASNEYTQAALDEPCRIDGPFDLAVCLEVGEHIDVQRAAAFVDNLVRLSPVILFSAAVPNQGGKNHINEQWPSYWADLFGRHGYDLYDVVRPVFWNNRTISVWFRQNMVLMVRRDHAAVVEAFKKASPGPVIDIIHPDLYAEKAVRLEKLLYGRFGPMVYIRLLAKSILRRLGVYRN